MRPRIFVASTTESLTIAYSVQENLEHDADVTVWTQGVFELSKSTVESLIGALGKSDFGVFLLTPDDVLRLRGEEHQVPRDNLVFELGLFIGRLGRDRTFIIAPRGISNFHLPSDLLGITPGTYVANRHDGNVVAALGPACNKIREAIKLKGTWEPLINHGDTTSAEAVGILDDADCLSVLESWWGNRTPVENGQVVKFMDVDCELNLPSGSASRLLEHAVARYGFKVVRRGLSTILFEQHLETPDSLANQLLRIRPGDW